MNYSTGVSGYWFVTDSTILSFAGDGARRLAQGPTTVVQPVERIFLADSASPQDEAQEEAAVGFCRVGDLAMKGATIECLAHTRAGLYAGTFVADGTPPKVEELAISP